MKSIHNIFFLTLFLVFSCQTNKMDKVSQQEDDKPSKQTNFTAEDYTLKVQTLLLDSIENESVELRKHLKIDE